MLNDLRKISNKNYIKLDLKERPTKTLCALVKGDHDSRKFYYNKKINHLSLIVYNIITREDIDTICD